jgi:hypothetical protein
MSTNGMSSKLNLIELPLTMNFLGIALTAKETELLVIVVSEMGGDIPNVSSPSQPQLLISLRSL